LNGGAVGFLFFVVFFFYLFCSFVSFGFVFVFVHLTFLLVEFGQILLRVFSEVNGDKQRLLCGGSISSGMFCRFCFPRNPTVILAFCYTGCAFEERGTLLTVGSAPI
jgi:hypothetical protein